MGCLTEEEKNYVNELENEQQRDALLKIWVQKEAIGKSLGIGLVLDLSSITVKYTFDIRKLSIVFTVGNKKIEGVVWREREFWACVVCACTIEMEGN